MSHDDSFLGTGWSFPPGFTRGGAEVELVSGEDDIHQSLQILTATRLNERVMQDGFGCDLDTLMFQEFDQGLVNRITDLISHAVLYHEPRIRLDRLDVTQNETEQGLLLIQLDYTIRHTHSRFSMVFPFYMN